jgi:hypothetical protein
MIQSSFTPVRTSPTVLVACLVSPFRLVVVVYAKLQTIITVPYPYDGILFHINNYFILFYSPSTLYLARRVIVCSISTHIFCTTVEALREGALQPTLSIITGYDHAQIAKKCKYINLFLRLMDMINCIQRW